MKEWERELKRVRARRARALEARGKPYKDEITVLTSKGFRPYGGDPESTFVKHYRATGGKPISIVLTRHSINWEVELLVGSSKIFSRVHRDVNSAIKTGEQFLRDALADRGLS